MDSVRENFYANECKATVVKRVGSKEQQDNKLINKIKSNAIFKTPAEDKSKVVKSDKTKPKGPPPLPPPSSPPQVVTLPKQTGRESTIYVCNKNDNDNDDDDADIPKTGFDFLDNW